MIKKNKAKIKQILLEASFDIIKKRNAARPMIIPNQQLKAQYQKIYQTRLRHEIIINTNFLTPKQIYNQALKISR